MSDIPSGALDSAESRAVSLLSRVILPRPGEPLDVRQLYIEESSTNARRAHAPTRTTLEIGAESEVSFATYFNAFPAGYWRRWTPVRKLRLTIVTRGAGRLIVFRSNARGSFQRQDFAQVQEGDPVAGEFSTETPEEGDTGEVIEIASEEIARLRREMLERLGFEIVSQHTLIRARRIKPAQPR